MQGLYHGAGCRLFVTYLFRVAFADGCLMRTEVDPPVLITGNDNKDDEEFVRVLERV